MARYPQMEGNSPLAVYNAVLIVAKTSDYFLDEKHDFAFQPYISSEGVQSLHTFLC